MTGVGYAGRGELLPVASSQPEQPQSLRELLVAALNCNDAQLEMGPHGYSVTGDPTEAALAVLAAKGGLDPQLNEHTLERLDVIPFESEQRYMATLHRMDADHNVAYAKGAPEVVLAMCSKELTQGGPRRLNS